MRIEHDYTSTLAAINTALTFQHQADAVLSQANPVSTTLYTILPATANVNIKAITFAITWAVTQPSTTVQITVDGNVYTITHTTPVSTQGYWIILSAQSGVVRHWYINSDNSVNDLAATLGYLFDGRSAKVEISTTWAVTQPTPLVASVKYGKR